MEIPDVRRPAPDQEIIERALKVTNHEQDQMQRYLREEWEAALGATRVALDVVRRLWPLEQYHFDDEEFDALEGLASDFGRAYATLEGMSAEMLGDLLNDACNGTLGEARLLEAEEEARH